MNSINVDFVTYTIFLENRNMICFISDQKNSVRVTKIRKKA